LIEDFKKDPIKKVKEYNMVSENKWNQANI
jgi:hypothetical protein